MPKARNEKADRARDLYRTGMKLVDIAQRLEVPSGTVRRWKCEYRWDGTPKPNAREKANVRNAPPEEDLPLMVDSGELTEKQRLFILYYAKNFNAARAYQKAYGCSYETALRNGSRLLKNADIRDEIIKLKRERCAKVLLEPEDVFQKYMEIAFADLTDFVDFGPDGVRPRPSEEVDGTLLSEISKGKDGLKVKLSDRMKALQWLGEHMNLATEEQQARIDKLRAETRQLLPSGEDREDDPITRSLKEAFHVLGEAD